jgi:selenocysteine-specific translation elongation factor
MKNLTIGIFGNREFIKELGKKSTVNDIAIYHHADSEHIFTFVSPNSDKIQPLLQTLQMTEVPILVLGELNAQVGEEIVGLGEMGFKQGFVILDNFSEEQYRKIVKDTTLEKFEIIPKSVPDVFSKLISVNIDRSGEASVPIDNYFNVKGVGTVILGIVRRGEVKKFDKMNAEPLGKEVMIKGIQIQDKDFDVAEGGSRVGFNLKGVEADELKRGYILCNNVEKTSKLANKIIKNKFYKGQPKDNEQLIVSSGLQCVTGLIKGNEIVLEKEMVLQRPVLVASTKQEGLRIIGKI